VPPILPSRSDLKLTWWASMSYVTELCEANVKIYMYKKGFTHGKLMLVDDVFSSVGTANMDIRSFDQNFEVNALIYDEAIARELKKYFLDDLQNCDRILPEKWAARKFSHRLRESFARLFSPLL
jgi:cardiolipin synthase